MSPEQRRDRFPGARGRTRAVRLVVPLMRPEKALSGQRLIESMHGVMWASAGVTNQKRLVACRRVILNSSSCSLRSRLLHCFTPKKRRSYRLLIARKKNNEPTPRRGGRHAVSAPEWPGRLLGAGALHRRTWQIGATGGAPICGAPRWTFCGRSSGVSSEGFGSSAPVLAGL